MASDYKRVDGKIIVTVEGDTDLVDMNALKDLLYDFIEEGVDIELDLSKVGFLNSSAIGLILLVKKKLKAKGCSLIISNLSDRIKKGFPSSTIDMLLG